MVNPLASLDSVKNLLFFLNAIGRKEHPDGPADDFLRLVTKGAFGAKVPAGDDGMEILADDRVVGGVDNCRKQAAQLCIAPLVADIASDLRSANDTAAVIFHRRDRKH